MIDQNPHRIRCSGSRAAVLAVLGILAAPSAWSANLTVDSLADSTVQDGLCTLREAIAAANGNSGVPGFDCGVAGDAAAPDTVTFGVSGRIVLGGALPAITDPAGLTLDGAGQQVILSGNGAVRVLQVNAGAALKVKNLTLADGNATAPVGGGFGAANGGGIDNRNGSVTVINSTFSGNKAANGGAIANQGDPLAPQDTGGKLTVVNSTFFGNDAYSSGGAIFNASSGRIEIVNSTLSGNSAITKACTADFCNTVVASGGGLSNNNFTVPGRVNNSIIAGNDAVIERSGTTPLVSPDDVVGGFQGSHNLIGTPTTGAAGNTFGVDAAAVLSSTLADNGGPTQTLALIASGPAVDTADDAICASAPVSGLDQRGVLRPQGAHCDIGAVEAVPEADINLTAGATPNPAMVRDAVTLRFEVSNRGPANADGVKVTDTYSATGLSSVTLKASQGTCTAPQSGKFVCNLGSLANGQTASVTLTGIAATAGTMTHLAAASAGQPDSRQGDNTATLSVGVQPLNCNGLTPTIVGTPGANTLKGTKGRDIIQGLGGNDIITGGGGDDIICGGEGQDSLSGEAGNDTLNGEAGTDTCNGGTGTDNAANCEARISIP